MATKPWVSLVQWQCRARNPWHSSSTRRFDNQWAFLCAPLSCPPSTLTSDPTSSTFPSCASHWWQVNRSPRRRDLKQALRLLSDILVRTEIVRKPPRSHIITPACRRRLRVNLRPQCTLQLHCLWFGAFRSAPKQCCLHCVMQNTPLHETTAGNLLWASHKALESYFIACFALFDWVQIVVCMLVINTLRGKVVEVPRLHERLSSTVFCIKFSPLRWVIGWMVVTVNCIHRLGQKLSILSLAYGSLKLLRNMCPRTKAAFFKIAFQVSNFIQPNTISYYKKACTHEDTLYVGNVFLKCRCKLWCKIS